MVPGTSGSWDADACGAARAWHGELAIDPAMRGVPIVDRAHTRAPAAGFTTPPSLAASARATAASIRRPARFRCPGSRRARQPGWREQSASHVLLECHGEPGRAIRWCDPISASVVALLSFTNGLLVAETVRGGSRDARRGEAAIVGARSAIRAAGPDRQAWDPAPVDRDADPDRRDSRG
jgi:hypothetical protein